MDPVDGNALAGPLGTLFGQDVGDVTGVCAGCGLSSLLAETRVFDQAPGLVARCPGCEEVLATVIEMPRAVRLSLPGFRYVDIPSRTL
ncbi:MAG: hypothetical protein KY451_08775 [Actinobacteria bacterium]|nr:hypothetical protein [Actinomycetota bacterium]